MHTVSRRNFVNTLAGVPFLMAAGARAFALPQSRALTSAQKEAVEAILRKLVDSGTVSAVSY